MSYYRVRVHATNEEQVFDTQKQAENWCDKVQYTFGDFSMTFDIIHITEIITEYPHKNICVCHKPISVVGSPIDTVATCKKCGKIIK